MAHAGGGRRAPIVGINVTPMVDVVLVLLVVMMVSATYIVSQSLKVELPKTATSDEAVNTVAAVTVTKEGKVFFNQEPVDEDQLRAHIASAVAENDALNLVISADGEALHGRVVHVIDVAKAEGVSKFAVHVERDE